MATFDENGNYVKTDWKAGDKITATKLNKIEESIEAVNNNDISRHVEADARLDKLESDTASDKQAINAKVDALEDVVEANKDATDLEIYSINQHMTLLDEDIEEALVEMNETIEEFKEGVKTNSQLANNIKAAVNNAKFEFTEMTEQALEDLEASGQIVITNANKVVNQGKADMEAMVAEVEDELTYNTNYILDQEVNVKFPPNGFVPALLDGVTDDTDAIQSLIDAGYKNIFIPEGVCCCNIQLPRDTPNIRGAGVSSTILKSAMPGGYAIQINVNDNWRKFMICDLSIEGDEDLTLGGIRFGNEPYQENDEFSGGLNLTRVNFKNLNIAIFKPYGNIGNTISECSFYKCNYHYYAENNEKHMHCGCDTFYKCHLQQAQITSVYIDSAYDGSGQTIFRDVIFEANPATVVHIEHYGGYYSPGIVFDCVWFEANATLENSYDMLIKNAKNVTLTNTLLGKIHLEKSIVRAQRCSDGTGFKITKDGNSMFSIESAYGWNITDPNIFTESIGFSGNGIIGQGNTFRTYPRLLISKQHTALVSLDLTSSVIFRGWSNVVGQVVDDGVLFDACNEFIINTNYEGFIGRAEIPKSKWCVLTLDAKLIEGSCSFLGIAYSIQFADRISNFLQRDKWVSIVTIFSTEGMSNDSESGGLYVKNHTGESMTIRLSAYQLHVFDTIEDATIFANSRLYCRQAPAE